MKVDEFIRKELKAYGFRVVNGSSGSHRYAYLPGTPGKISVPYHKGRDVPVGTAGSIISQRDEILKKAGR